MKRQKPWTPLEQLMARHGANIIPIEAAHAVRFKRFDLELRREIAKAFTIPPELLNRG